MDNFLKQESEKLARSWMRHDTAHLRGYLVASVEDPRVNVQSVLTRHFLLAALFGAKFERLMEEELRFAAVMNWWHRNAAHLKTPEGRTTLLHALRRGADDAEGLEIPGFVRRAFAGLPVQARQVSVPNYIEQSLAEEALPQSPAGVRRPALDTFQELWADALAGETRQAVRALEPACGSANDFRFLASYGIARLLDYTGFDLCEKNVKNARALFPGVRFDLGNVFGIPAADGAFDLSFVHDLFEHLSLEALPVAVREICRVTRRGLCIGFFQMDETPGHIVRPVEEYHVNTLSLARTQALFGEQGFDVQPLHVGSFLRWRIGCAETHNPNAYTFLAFRP
jgi:SAM-dependent methyltransferase